MCEYFNTFIETENFYSYTLHILTFFEILINSFVAFCILFKTPKNMISVIPSMIILHFTSTILDLYLSLLTCPFIFLPYAAGYPLGLFKYLGVPTSIQVYFGVTFIGDTFLGIFW
ncbi:unnamed protein product [Caenorhabditis angaria]|uniref:Uncharacterized protein n=1 Tax=Caenorhabditis angaria TaxID=860376 RepID=A0A9P1IHF3_9PELO|nr:unnamed protein product [Caenorhabditis angaria]